MELQPEHAFVARAEWSDGTCQVSVEAWSLEEAERRAARMRGVRWIGVSQGPRGTWKLSGVQE